MRLSNDIWDRLRFCRRSNSGKSETGPIPWTSFLVYFDKILHTNYYWHDLDRGITKSSPRDWKMTFNIGRGCAELQILKKVKMAELSGLLWWNFAYILILTRCSPTDCRMLFGIDRGVAEVQILTKQWNWPYLFKLFEYFDKIMHIHCYWRELDRRIAKCHLSSVEAMPRSKS